MMRTRKTLIVILFLFILLAAWLWWVRPTRTDMASNAPEDSLIYLESNDPAGLLSALTKTDAWRIVDTLSAKHRNYDQGNWAKSFVRWTGIGPIDSVILTRAQLAIVITDLGGAEEGETLTVKPEGALLVETHTSERRIKEPVEQALKKFAENAYGQPSLRKVMIDEHEFLEWIAPGGSRQLVATIAGSLVIVGNSERAVRKALATSLGRQPSLKSDSELVTMRSDLEGANSLAFGYVPAKKSSQLLSVGIPIMLGRVPANSEFERLISSNSAKLIGALGWSSRPFQNGVEDRYRINTAADVIGSLKEKLNCHPAELSSQPKLPDNFSSATYYEFRNPDSAWQGLKTTVSTHVDAVSAILFSSVLKSALLSYGISEPEKFLASVNYPVMTARFDTEVPGSMLVARLSDRGAMRNLLTNEMGFKVVSNVPNAEVFLNTESESSAALENDLIMIGSQAEVDRYREKLSASSNAPANIPRADTSSEFSGGICTLTFSDDSDRVRSFVATMLKTSGRAAPWSDEAERMLTALPYSVTKTTVEEHGIERITHSPLGQFSTIMPLLFPEQAQAKPSD